MGQLVFQATLGGQVALVGPNTASSFSLNLPTVNGTVVTTGDTGTVTNTMLAASAYTAPGTIGSGTPNTGAFTSLSATSFTNTGTESATAFIPTGSAIPTNGLYLPAANKIGLSTNNTNAITIDSSQNVGIGTNSPGAKLQVNSEIRTVNGTNVGQWLVDGTDVYFGPTGATNLRLQTNGNTRAIIDSSGNVGIGVAPYTNGIVIGKTVAGLVYSDVANYSNTNATDGVDLRLITQNVAGSGTTSVDFSKTKNGAFNIFNNETNSAAYMGFGVGSSERMRIDSSGNVGIGTSTMLAKFNAVGYVNSGGQNYSGLFTDNVLSNLRIGHQTGIANLISDQAVAIYTSNTEKMRIDTSGNLLVGTTSQLAGTSFANFSTGNGWVMGIRNTANSSGINITNGSGTASYTAIGFYNNGLTYSSTGTITVSGITTAYTSVSDHRLKENVQPMVGALDTVAQLKPVTYDWIGDKSKGQGFIAHELQAVVPDCVTGEKDAVDAEGNPVYQGIDTSFLVATLTAAIQELKAEVDALKAQLGAK